MLCGFPDCIDTAGCQERYANTLRKNFTLRVTEHWSRLPREAADSPSLEIFKTRMDKVLCSLL